MTATLSLEAAHETEIDDVVEPVFVSVPGVVGAVVSAPPPHGLVAAEAVVTAERLPASS